MEVMEVMEGKAKPTDLSYVKVAEEIAALGKKGCFGKAPARSTSDLDDLLARLGSTALHPPIGTKNPPSPWQPDRPRRTSSADH
ncbi:hypothetical protein FNH09_11080 [Streptomyces adustus]|uniref:Uncharacterized protein n=1 Tax=Streptomyces adustus TaxID=1609272 RepID=A0A5N8VAY6_9ACTN|nr:hypothetical protein [Streptomyces adustus]MPY31812.1 hypothetical protein [Streptomyces adustus]